MKYLLSGLAALLPLSALAETFQRPIPLPQTASAEIAFLVASILLVLALVAVHVLVNRK